MSWRVEAWAAEIDLRGCSPDEYRDAIEDSTPHEYQCATRADVDALLDSIEAIEARGNTVRTVVEAFVYSPRARQPFLAFHRARDGAFVQPGSPLSLSEGRY